MFIGRPFLLKKETLAPGNDSPANSETSIPESQTTADNGTHRHLLSRKDLIDDCIEAATEALEICQELRGSDPGLARASYIEYSSCRASLLVLIAYSIQNFSEQFRKLLYNGLDMIREMSAAGESARSEVSLIETLERALARLHTGSRQSHHTEDTTQANAAVSDYEAFKNWGSRLKEADMLDAPVSAPSFPTHQVGDSVLSSSQPSVYDHLVGVDRTGASFTVSDRDINVGMLGVLDPIVEMSIFGAENSSPSAAWPTWTETQVLEHFLTNSEYEANQGMNAARY